MQKSNNSAGVPYKFHSFSRTGFMKGGLLSIAALFIVTHGGFAQQFEDWEEEPDSNWGFRFSGRTIFNLELSVTESSLPNTAGYYDNGFVLPDVSGSATTWNWGYDNNNQVGPNAGVPANQILFTRFSNLPGTGTYSESQGVSIGGELLGTYELFETIIKDKKVVGGFELGYGYQPIAIDYNATGTSTATYSQNFHSLNGVIPPAAPYSGTFNGPGSLIGLNPIQTINTTATATSNYSSDFSGDFHIVKIGLWGDLDLNEKWTLGMSGGLSSIFADTIYEYQNTTTFNNPAVPTQTESGRIGGRKWMAGIYNQVRIQYNVTENFGVFAGGEVELHSDFDFEGNGKKFVMDMAPLYGGTLGINWQF